VVQHDLQWIYISGLLQCDFCTAGLLFAYPRKSGSLGFRKTTLVDERKDSLVSTVSVSDTLMS
jgi:hypothetical protein